MNRKERDSLLRECVYLDEKDIDQCVKQGRAYATIRGCKGTVFWVVTARTARKLAQQLNDERMKKDLNR